ncbi:hypothetical protein B7P34_19360 [Streptosporangium nondiastaticum]|uniref:DUF4190 domain-containing protein n=1 Tax=Streptosporangium nondiastaticum TaxID=35764 RepID=A0A9X7PGJ9_9ACTN|nr:DUF4190 domain-containing protein [Streptosporangium nondiastaticum]PSJ27098.1 hypothetical protein B7P34_19360 [Streptosporangium nondiastaticum]
MTSDIGRTAAPLTEQRNVPARISAWSAALGVSLIVAAFATPMMWMLYGSYYTFFMALLGIVAIPTGHVGRFRGKRLGGRDRGLALLGIITGWLLILCALLIVLAYIGLIAGLALLTDAVR